jgi:LPS-assembly protein
MCGITSPYNSVFFSILFFLVSNNIFADNASLDSRQVMDSCAAEDSAIKHVQPREFPEESIENTEISADYTQSSSDGSTSLDGNVIIEKHLLRVSADHAHYDQQQNTLQVSGNVHLDTPALSLNASAGSVDMNDTGKQGEFNDVMFLIPTNNMKGKADSINADDKKHATLTNASITSCHFLDPDWLISADEIRLDLNDEYGSADDVVIRFKNVPFMYTPYIEFPTSDKRRSGLLFPEFGTSTSRGIELSTPVYWNIAPNQDAVITPHFMDRRGLELGGNYRYLTHSTNGELTGAYLPEDDITNETRYQVYYLQHSRILQNLQLDIQYQDISDSDYFNDFSNSLGATSQTVLNRDVTLRYDLKNWHMKALVQDIKTIDTSTPVSDRPYQRLPQLTLNGDTEVAGSDLLFTLDSEYVDFTHEDENIVTGQRATVTPGLQLPLSGAAWFIKPAIKLNATQYDIGTNASTSQDVESRTLPISNIDAGLFFERFLVNGYQQTLEPRLYYLYVPYEDQNNIPVFDTNIPEFTVSQLFRDNRFIGGDRIGDANQLTVALTSRISNPDTGNEILRASIGQIFYFEDRQVSLDDSIDTAKQSDIIAELDANWGYWQTNVDLQWDVTNNNLSKETYFLHYRTDARHLFNIGYRKRMENNSIDIEQTDTSFVYAINRKYSGIVRWNYSLDEKKNIDSIAGVAYDSCCWSIQLLAQSRIQNSTTATADYDNSILVQFVFKGLGNVAGSKAKNTLEQSIFGYTDILQ